MNDAANDTPAHAKKEHPLPPYPGCFSLAAYDIVPPKNTGTLPAYPGRYISEYFIDDYDLHPDFLYKYGVFIDAELGAGGHGFVLHGWQLLDNKEVAIKVVMRKKNSSSWPVHPKYGQVPNDVMIMEQLDHDGIARLLDVMSDDHYVYVVSFVAFPIRDETN